MKVQSTFTERIARIESGSTFGSSDAIPSGKSARKGRRKKWLHLDMLVAGGLAGGTAGILFAKNVGLAYMVTLDVTTLSELVQTDYLTAAIIAGVAIAPVGFVLGKMFARSNPRGWQFWIGYLTGVFCANASDLEAYLNTLTLTPA